MVGQVILGSIPGNQLILVGSGPRTDGYVVKDHGDHKSPNWGCGTPSKWPFHGL